MMVDDDQVMLDAIHERGKLLATRLKAQKTNHEGSGCLERLKSELSCYLQDISHLCNERIQKISCSEPISESHFVTVGTPLRTLSAPGNADLIGIDR